jgi:hypothetical protein
MGLLEILDHRLCGAAQDEPLSPGPGQAGNPGKGQNENCCDRCDLHEECNCAPIVHESNDFIPFGLLLSEKQIPRFVGNVSS